MLDPAAWKRVRELFDRALELPAPERESFLAREATDPAIRAEVSSLLEHLEKEDGFLESPPPAPAAAFSAPPDPALAPGARVGPWRLVREIGSGGMGRVFEAERADGLFEKRVAVKFIRRGMDSESILQRFHREREILAALEHPGIARLLDGGISETGQPWFVMELVEGVPITRYCRERALSVTERIRLFQAVCAAVHFAHQNLVIHRDLKPSNLLVTAEGEVKLLDFGVARLLDPGLDPEGGLTEVGDRVLTPAYASPEQLSGASVTTATDVYSLGVLLYELLTGQRPFEPRSSSLQTLLEERATTDPVPPSEAARTGIPSSDASERSGPDPDPTLPHLLRGDLDNIVLMALRREPERRYSSVAELADDLERHLAGFPVRARPNTAGYRLRTFARRHRVGVSAAAVTLLALVGGGALAVWQAGVAESERARAEARFEERREITTTLLFDVHDAIEPLAGATAARELLVSRTFDHLAGLAEQGAGDPTLTRDLALGYLRLASIAGDPTGASLGDTDGALRALREAEALAAGLLAISPDDPENLALMASTERRLGDVLPWLGEIEEGIEHLARSLAHYEAVASGASPDEEAPHLEVVIAHVKLSDHTGHPVFPNLEDPEGALAGYLQALEVLESPPLAASEAWGVRRFRGLVHERIGAMHRAAGEPGEALSHLAHSLSAREEMAREDPSNMNALRDVAVGLQLLCEVTSEAGRPIEGLPHCEEALVRFTELRARDLENRQAHVDIAFYHAAHARVLVRAGDTSGARAAIAEGIRTREALYEADPSHALNRHHLEALREWLASLEGG